MRTYMPRDPYPLPQHTDRGASIPSLPQQIAFRPRTCLSCLPSFWHRSPPPPSAQLLTPWGTCPTPDALRSSGRLAAVVTYSIFKFDRMCWITHCIEQTETAHTRPNGDRSGYSPENPPVERNGEDESNCLTRTCISCKTENSLQTANGEKEKSIWWVVYGFIR